MKHILKIASCAWIANMLVLQNNNILLGIITTFALMVLFNVWKEYK